MNYWVNTISKDHVLRGGEGGFTQADHGKNTRLRLLQRGDLLVFYSPRTALRSGAPVQTFTVVGCVIDDMPYQVEMPPSFLRGGASWTSRAGMRRRIGASSPRSTPS